MNLRITAIGMALLAAPGATAQTLPQFDVASVRVTRDSTGKWNMATPGGGRFSATGISAKSLIINAFRIIRLQLSGGPSWIESERYDIDAKTAGSDQITRDQMGLLLQSLLADRFGLRYHFEKREVSGYSLIVAKGGPKLAKNSGQQAGMETGRGRVTGHNEPLTELARELGGQFDNFVTDDTGVAGSFDFTLEWAYSADQESNLPSIFSALQEQLGLKLAPRKGPVDILVIDHIEKPSEN